MTEQLRVGKRGAVVIPVQLRRQYHIQEGARMAVEARDDGLLLTVLPVGPSEEERHRFFADLADQVAATRADPSAWKKELAERELLNGTLLDGLSGPESAVDA